MKKKVFHFLKLLLRFFAFLLAGCSIQNILLKYLHTVYQIICIHIYQCFPIDFFASHGQVIGSVYHLKTDKRLSNTLDRLEYIFLRAKNMVIRNILIHIENTHLLFFILDIFHSSFFFHSKLIILHIFLLILGFFATHGQMIGSIYHILHAFHFSFFRHFPFNTFFIHYPFAFFILHIYHFRFFSFHNFLDIFLHILDFFGSDGQVLGPIYNLKTDKSLSNTLNRLEYIF